MRPDYKKFDSIDIYISGDTTPEESKAVSEFLKTYKAKQARAKKASPTSSTGTPPRKKAKAKAK
ncbi:MAG: hypothetical protein Q8922_08210 [Bacteroidota bacterium]|nr:hypothetical protein [Bacteroidota bacterium]MDP4234206.1 hypothetical protein [Bacteroidota bacterium]MDP4243728.1 hypothetical protein [Bacteroidota bacterium]MDP4287907.1 hypothetical protein [Bacteroidota bacterium]